MKDRKTVYWLAGSFLLLPLFSVILPGISASSIEGPAIDPGIGEGALHPEHPSSSPLTSGSSTNPWTNLKPAGSTPSARRSHAMAYDTKHELVVLFGGSDSDSDTDSYLGDTWAYNTSANVWTGMAPTGSTPPARESHAMVYDAVHDVIVLFGGRGSAGFLSDTWAYNLSANAWTERAPTGSTPPAQWHHAMAFDATHGVTVLFGRGPSSTWIYNFSSNEWTKVDRPPFPTSRSSHAMAYDAARGVAVLFGGVTGGRGSTGSLSDTWTYNLSAYTHERWVEVNPTDSPPARWGHAMVYDAARGATILFGGSNGEYRAIDREGSTSLGDTWAYDSFANVWTNSNPAGITPPARWDHAMAYDAAQDVVILFGGSNGTHSFLGDTWTYGVSPVLAAPVLSLTTPSPSVTGNATLTWTAVDGATTYKVYRNAMLITNTTATTFTDVGRPKGTYYYAVIAANASGESFISNRVHIEVQTPSDLFLSQWGVHLLIVLGALGLVASIIMYVKYKNPRQRERLISRGRWKSAGGNDLGPGHKTAIVESHYFRGFILLVMIGSSTALAIGLLRAIGLGGGVAVVITLLVGLGASIFVLFFVMRNKVGGTREKYGDY